MKPRLELTWIGKENRPRLEPRIVLEDVTRAYHAPHRVTDRDLFDNRLILVYRMAFRGSTAAWTNLTGKKIPNALLHRCKWGRDNYSLQVAALPPAPEPAPAPEGPHQAARRRKAAPLPLFEGVK